MVRPSGRLLAVNGDPKWYNSKVARVNISWVVLTFLGIGSFAIAKQDAVNKRYQFMKERQAIQTTVESEVKEAAESKK